MPRLAQGWHKILWRIVTNPTVEVVVAIVVVLISAWIVIQTETEQRSTPFPVIFHR
ncbi:MAG TPA: hypothetical protein VEG27_05370 [Usitatibacter sp.]|nr:hypothetical protein [Usitatibacter sp.]